MSKSLFFSAAYLPGAWRDFRASFPNDSLGAFGGRHGPVPPGSAYVNMETAALCVVQYIPPTPLEFSRPTRKKNRVSGTSWTQE